jgi:hypothetical protein
MRSSARLAVAKKRQRFSLGSDSDFEANVAAVAPPGKHIHLEATAQKPGKPHLKNTRKSPKSKNG